MQRHEMIEAFAQLGLKGMAGAFDETVTTVEQEDRSSRRVAVGVGLDPEPTLAGEIVGDVERDHGHRGERTGPS